MEEPNNNPSPAEPNLQNGDPAGSVARPAMIAGASEGARALGLPSLARATVASLCQIGVDAENYGLIKVAGGGLICTIQGIAEMQERVLDLVKSPSAKDKTVLQAALAFAALARAMHGCASSVKADGIASQAKQPERKQKRVFAGTITNAPASGSVPGST